MRDAVAFGFGGHKQETVANGAQDANFKGTYVSTNRYYGYQPLPQKEPEEQEYMDVQISDSGIQFNNFIAPEDRLSGLQEGRVTRGPVNRKRRWSDDAPQFEFKKRRENEPFPEFPTANRYVNSRQPTHNVPDMPRCLTGHFI